MRTKLTRDCSETYSMGFRNPNIRTLKVCLDIAGFWDGTAKNDRVDSTLLYWMDHFCKEHPHMEYATTPDRMYRVVQIWLEIRFGINDRGMILPKADVAEVAQAEVLKNPFLGIIDPKYLVPSAVSINPEAYYGRVDDVKLVRLDLPFSFVASWDTSLIIRRLTVNKIIAKDLYNALVELLDTIGHDRIVNADINLTGGCYNRRRVRGGRRWSSHSWGTAIDFHPLGNPMEAMVEDTISYQNSDWWLFANIMQKHGFRTLKHDLMHWQWVPERAR